MSKRLIMSCMALVAFAAFALPATASATNDPDLTDGGVLLGTGTTIVGTAKNILFTNTAGTEIKFTCSEATLTGILKANTGTKVEWEIAKGSATVRGTGAVSAH